MRIRARGVRWNRTVIGALFALLLASLITVGNAGSVSADVSVNIMNFSFQPTPLTIPVGTTVVWTNQDSASHTATSDTAGVFDTGTLAKGQSGKVTFNTVGTITYHCNIHPNMHGVVVVTGAAAPPAASVAPPSGGVQAFADPAFQALWAKSDAAPAGHSYIWGPSPFTGGVMEEYKEAPGGKRLVQYFDKARMELTIPGGPVTAGLLSVELITGRQQNGDATFVQHDPARITVAGDPDNLFPTYADLAKLQAAETDTSGSGAPITKMVNLNGAASAYAPASTDALAKTTGYDAVTKHNIPKAFVDFRNAPDLGGIQAIGLAITEPVWANVKVGGKMVPVLVQAFERRVLTYTPDNPIQFRVEYGNIGRAYNTWRSSVPATATVAPAPAVTTPAGTMPSTNDPKGMPEPTSGYYG
jgi:plastocyanin